MVLTIYLIENKTKTKKKTYKKNYSFHLNHLFLVFKIILFSYYILGDFMYSLIARFMENITKEQIDTFAKKNKTFLSNEELDFTYTFVKKNWELILRNPNLLQFERLKDHYSAENLVKIQKVFQAYYQKYGHLL